MIEDEGMKITTIDIANEKLSTRVYPVGDLVITLSGQSLGGGLGGALGGGGGGLGGGQQGGGGFGGGGGGFGGGGGGGQFMVAPKAVIPKGMSNMQKNEAAPKPKQIADPELQGLLNGVLKKNSAPQPVGQEAAAVETPSFSGLAQVPDVPFRFDNKTIFDLKKKR